MSPPSSPTSGPTSSRLSPRRRLHPADDRLIIEGTSLLHLHTHRARRASRSTSKLRRARRSTRNSSPPPTWSLRPKSPVRLPASDSARRAQGDQSLDRVRHPVGIRLHRPLPRHAEPRHRLRHLGRHRATRHRRRRLHPHPQGHAERRHQRRPDGRREGILAGIIKARDRCRVRDGVRPVGCCRLHGLVSHRDRAGVPAARGRGHRQPGRQLRAAPCRPGRHVGGRALSDVRGQ